MALEPSLQAAIDKALAEQWKDYIHHGTKPMWQGRDNVYVQLYKMCKVAACHASNTSIADFKEDEDNPAYLYIIDSIARKFPFQSTQEYSLRTTLIERITRLAKDIRAGVNISNEIDRRRIAIYEKRGNIGTVQKIIQDPQTAAVAAYGLANGLLSTGAKAINYADKARRAASLAESSTNLGNAARTTTLAARSTSYARRSVALAALTPVAGLIGAANVPESLEFVEKRISTAHASAPKKGGGYTPVPDWMKGAFGVTNYATSSPEDRSKALAAAQKKEEYYKKLYNQVSVSHKPIYVAACKKTLTPAEIENKYREYQQFTFELRQSAVIPQWMKQKYHITDFKKLSDEDLVSAYKWAKQQFDFNLRQLGTGGAVIAIGQKKYNRNTIDVKTCQYANFLNKLNEEIEHRNKALTEASARAEAEADVVAPATAQYQAAVTPVNGQGNPNAAAMGQQGGGAAMGQQGTATAQGTGGDCWGGLISKLLNGLGGVGIGTAIANLPDNILGMFTGESKTFGFNTGTMMPLALIYGSRFMRNPAIKTAMFTGGLAGLIKQSGEENKAQAALAQGASTRKYADEPLNPRVSQPEMAGGRMVLHIDGVVKVISFTPDVVEAYEKGQIPINTLANRVLVNYDRQQAATAQVTAQQQENTSRTYDESQPREQSRGIR